MLQVAVAVAAAVSRCGHISHTKAGRGCAWKSPFCKCGRACGMKGCGGAIILLRAIAGSSTSAPQRGEIYYMLGSARLRLMYHCTYQVTQWLWLMTEHMDNERSKQCNAQLISQYSHSHCHKPCRSDSSATRAISKCNPRLWQLPIEESFLAGFGE